MGQACGAQAARGSAALLAALLVGSVIAVSLLSGALFPAQAQAGPGLSQVRLELERTDVLIERAREEIAEVRNAYSQDRLRKALDVQRRAWNQFHTGTANGLRNAQGLTRNARAFALQAIEAAGIEKRARDKVGTIIEQAQERAAEIAPLVNESGGPLARRLMEQGLQQLRRARRALQDNDPQAARLATLALHLIERAGRAAAGIGATVAAAEVSIERTETLLAEVEARLAEEGRPVSPQALFDEAQRLLEQAHKDLSDGRPGLAFRSSAEARERALRALSELKRVPGEEQILITLEDIEALYDELAPRIEASRASDAMGLLRQGRELLAKARSLLGEGKPGEALITLVAAESLLRRAAEAAGID
ncbi:MAG: hypothetical protein V1774_07860 [Candidatus Eisenbacteria bacterium]